MFHKQKYSRLQVQTRYKSFLKSLALVNFYYSETSKVTSLQAIDALQILLECQLHVKKLFQSTFSQRPSWPITSYEIRKLQAAEVPNINKTIFRNNLRELQSRKNPTRCLCS